MTTQASPADGLLAILEGIAGFLDGWEAHVGRFNTSPNKQIVLRNTGGRSGEVKVAIDYPSVQVLIKGAPKGYAEAWSKLKDIRDALVAIPTPTADYPALTSCVAMGDINDLEYDDSDRPQFSQNFQLITSYAVSGYRDY